MEIVARRLFPELISPFLLDKLESLRQRYGSASWAYRSVADQYIYNPNESLNREQSTFRHYNGDVFGTKDGEALLGVERLYRHTVLLELTTACVANCRWCLRANYPRFSLKTDQISRNIRYFGSERLRDDLTEILITGGDPMIAPQRLAFALDEIAQHAPNIRIVRIGSRIFTQNPALVDPDMRRIFKKHKDHFRIEFGTMINSPVEFWPETIAAIRGLQDLGARFYLQHPLLRGINDRAEHLIQLYDLARMHGIEPHYLFHCVPMQGQHHHRTTVGEGLDLIRRLTTGGEISGRVKPKYALMTEIGKITMWEGTILRQDAETGMLLLRSSYRLEDRLRFNPDFLLPASAFVDEEGMMNVWYPDGDAGA